MNGLDIGRSAVPLLHIVLDLLRQFLNALGRYGQGKGCGWINADEGGQHSRAYAREFLSRINHVPMKTRIVTEEGQFVRADCLVMEIEPGGKPFENGMAGQFFRLLGFTPFGRGACPALVFGSLRGIGLRDGRGDRNLKSAGFKFAGNRIRAPLLEEIKGEDEGGAYQNESNSSQCMSSHGLV